MLAAKGKGGSTSHRYRPASEYDDATLAQKREYWRNKKRQQRARLSEQRRKPAKEKRDSAAGTLSNFALSRPLYSNVSCVASLKRRGTDGVGDREEKCLETANLKGFQLTSGSVVAPGATATRVVSSPSSSGTQLSTSSSRPPAIDSSVTNGSSIKAEPQPRVSMQGRSVPKTLLKAHVLLPILPMTDLLATQMKRAPISSKAAVPRSGSKSALVSRRRAEGPPQLPSVSEEEKAARRREHWRLKKREQRAKLAAQTAQVKERTQTGGGTHQRTTAQRTVSGFLLPSQTFLRGMGQKLCSVRVKVPFIAARHDSDKPQSRSVSMVPAGPIKAQNSQKSRRKQPALTCDVNSGRKPADSQRRAGGLGPSDARGIAPCRSPRLKFIDAQKRFVSLGNLRCKSPSVASVLSTRGPPKADPNDSPEQIIAKRREYWRIKKREQRAKLSLESKTRAQEKQSLMRRVRRYQQILADLRKARALTHSTGSVLSPDSETIGGFIKEDGTLTVNLPSYRNAAGGGCKEERSGGPQNVHMTRAQHGAGTTRGRVDPVQESRAPPQGVQPAHRPPGLLLITPHISSSHSGPPSATSQRVGPLTHSGTPQNTGSTSGSGGGSCVMKVAVSSCAPSQNVSLPEDDRIAKRRGYWRIKKREQRAARAILLKHSSALLKRRAQRPDLATAATTRAEDTPHGNDIKQESVSTSDLRSPAEPPPCTPPAAPGLQLELDPSLYSDSQATTLLAVASMKKLLEESLSSVAECQTEQLGLQIKLDEDDSELDVKPAVSQLIFENDAADAALQKKGWDPGSDDVVPKDSVSPQLNSSLVGDMLPSFPTCSEVELLTCEHSSQPISNLTENQIVEASGSPCRTQRLLSDNLQDICSPEPAQVHHLPAMSLYLPHQQQQQQHQGWSQSSSLPPAQTHTDVGAERSGLTSLQRKREYWKLMKRQQRARLRAKQKEQPSKSSSRPLVENIQVPGPLKDVGRCKPAPQPHLSLASVAAGTAIPTVLVVRRTAANPDRSPDTLQVKLPMTSREDRMNVGSFDDRCLHKQPHRSLAPCFSALNPPDNPLSSIHLRSIALPGQTSNFIKNSSCGLQSQSSSHLAPISTLVPPKPIPGESEEDFLRRKREYWRIKKKEQRARKAVRDKEPLAHVVSNSWSPVLPVQGLQTSGAAQGVGLPVRAQTEAEPCTEEPGQPPGNGSGEDPGRWGDPSVDSEPLKSLKVDPDPSHDTPQVSDEPEPLLTDYGGYNEDEGPPSEVAWRNRYLMDYDPLNQLLVCMVCGELQYSHTLEGVRAHIDEAHPHTMTLDPREKQQILEGWDEQVSQRERFFTSQLQQHSAVLAESYRS